MISKKEINSFISSKGMLLDIRISVEPIRELQASINKCEHISHKHAIGPRFQSHMVEESRHIIYFVHSQGFLFVDAENARYLDIWWVCGRLHFNSSHKDHLSGIS